jgi:chaperonin GroEL
MRLILAQHIAYAPESQLLLGRGIERLNRLLSLTLGPTQCRVAMSGASSAIDLLDDASQLCKQVLSFGDSLEDVGYQCLRNALNELNDRTDDGIATCSVLTHAILKETVPLLAFGHHPVLLQRGIRHWHAAARDWLQQRAWTIDDPGDIAAVLRTANMSSQVAELIAEIVDAIGVDGTIVVEETQQLGIANEYVRGGRWNKGVAAPGFLDPNPNQVTIREPSILVTDQPIVAVQDAVAILEAASGSRSLLMIAPSFSDNVVALLLANRDTSGFESILAVKAPDSVHSGSQQLEDIALLAGGRFLPREEAGALRSVSSGDLGRADRAWASRSAFGIIGGAGEPQAVQRRAAALRAFARNESDPVRKAHFNTRAGNLTGLSALVRIGTGMRSGPTKRQIERATAIARSALESGVLEGGGLALARAGQFVTRECRGSEHEVSGMVLARALAAPMTTIVEQSGREAGSLLHCLPTNDDVFDVRTGAWVDPRESGLVDPLAVIEGALDVATSTALMVLSTDVLIGRHARR